MRLLKKVMAASLAMCLILSLSVGVSAYNGQIINFHGARGQVEAWTDGRLKHGLASTYCAGASVKAQNDMNNLSTGALLSRSPTNTGLTDVNAITQASNQSVRVYGAHQVLAGGVWRGDYTSVEDYA